MTSHDSYSYAVWGPLIRKLLRHGYIGCGRQADRQAGNGANLQVQVKQLIFRKRTPAS